MTTEFEADLARVAAAVERELDALFPGDETAPRLRRAMRYAMTGGGKRLRPYVVLTAAELFGEAHPGAMRVAAALECLHTYSLVHDDLPAMDDDDLRRGRPTVHREFDEATAILCGDALLTLAFEILGDERTHPDAAIRAGLVLRLARAAGAEGMVEGQMRDLEAEGRALTEREILDLQGMKTGALFAFAGEAGALVAGAPGEDCARLGRFGAALGLAFQIADDLLDEEGTAAALGKATAKDRARGKATLPALLGADEARARLEAAVTAGRGLLSPYGERAGRLAAALHFAATRSR